MNKSKIYFEHFKVVPGDIEEHLDTLSEYASKCNTVTELGTRALVSTWAFMVAHPKKLITIDKVHPSEYGAIQMLNEANKAAREEFIDFKFILADDLEIQIDETDLLFIDTLHTREQLTKELQLHASKVKKYIIFHDTEIPEMRDTILGFLNKNKEWKIIEDKHNNNGLMVIGKII